MYNIEDLTEQARRSGASDIHLVCGLPPKYRLDGQLENMAEEHLSEKDCDMLARIWRKTLCTKNWNIPENLIFPVK